MAGNKAKALVDGGARQELKLSERAYRIAEVARYRAAFPQATWRQVCSRFHFSAQTLSEYQHTELYQREYAAAAKGLVGEHAAAARSYLNEQIPAYVLEIDALARDRSDKRSQLQALRLVFEMTGLTQPQSVHVSSAVINLQQNIAQLVRDSSGALPVAVGGAVVDGVARDITQAAAGDGGSEPASASGASGSGSMADSGGNAQ